jgi:hypothetical protein
MVITFILPPGINPGESIPLTGAEKVGNFQAENWAVFKRKKQ